MNNRNNASSEFKTKVVLEVLEEATVDEIVARHLKKSTSAFERKGYTPDC